MIEAIEFLKGNIESGDLAELTYYFMAEGSSVLMLFGVNALSVFAGEMISVFILGIVFFKPFERFYQLQLNK